MPTTIDTYNNSSNFTFSGTEIEFSGSIARLKKLPLQGSETLVATYYDSVNADRGAGSITGALTGAGVISSNKFVAQGDIVSYIDYNIANFTTSTQGTIRFKYTPNYSGTPAGNRYLFSIGQAGNANNSINIYHNTSGQLFAELFDSVGSSVNIASAWSPTSGVEYLISLDFNTANTAQIAVDGVQLSSVAATITRTLAGLTTIRLGSDRTAVAASDGSFRHLEIYSTRQFSTSYTGSLPINVYRYSTTTGYKITPNSSFDADGLTSLADNVDDNTGSHKYTVSVDAVEKYWNGSAWATSSGHTQTSTLSQVNANAASLDIDQGVSLKIVPYLYSTGYETPEITTVTTVYDFYQEPIAIDECVLYGQVVDPAGDPVAAATVRFDINGFFKDGAYVAPVRIETTTDTSGRWEKSLSVMASTTGLLKVTYIYPSSLNPKPKNKVFSNLVIPNSETVNISTLV